MADRIALHTAVDRLAGRLRSLPQRRLQAGAAAEARELARWLARQAQAVEFPGREPYELPDDGMFVVGDQLAVAGHDLLAALSARLADGADPERVGALLEEALARVTRTARAVG
ncbi:hypothetical protein [Streptomyces sp.]|uniref:hypothetical protein n=1 Tax=Streptomyces sp. TaxID=1931 RepID=UPI002F3F7B0F